MSYENGIHCRVFPLIHSDDNAEKATPQSGQMQMPIGKCAQDLYRQLLSRHTEEERMREKGRGECVRFPREPTRTIRKRWKRNYFERRDVSGGAAAANERVVAFDRCYRVDGPYH